MMNKDFQSGVIVYHTADGRSDIRLYAKDGSVCRNPLQTRELFDISKRNVNHYIKNILREKELHEYSVVKDYLTTAELRIKSGKDLTLGFWRDHAGGRYNDFEQRRSKFKTLQADLENDEIMALGKKAKTREKMESKI